MKDWISIHDRIPDAETETCSVDCHFLCADGVKDTGYLYLDDVYRGKAFSYSSRSNQEISHWKPLEDSHE